MKNFFTLLVITAFAFSLNAQYLSKDFDDSSITSGGWTEHNVIGAVNYYIYMDGSNPVGSIKNYNGTTNEACETWFISPSIDLSTATQPVLNFKNACSYSGADLEVYISSDYDGTSAPSSATWTQKTFTLSTGFFAWANSGDIDLSSYITNGVYVAFKYTGTSTDGKTSEIDDIVVGEYTPFVPTVVNLPVAKDFNDNDINSGGWTQEVVVGSTTWYLGENVGDYYAKISNYNGTSNNEAESWLISPGINIVYTPSVVLNFRNAYKFAGNPLQLMVSNDYTGQGSPAAATWTDITSSATWSSGDWLFVGSGDITLPTYTNDTIYVAFKYTGSTTDGSTWEVDDIYLSSSSNIDNVSDNGSFRLFPNPTKDYFEFESDKEVVGYEIITVNGVKVISNSEISSMRSSIDVSDLKAGVYMITFTFEDETQSIQRLKIQ